MEQCASCPEPKGFGAAIAGTTSVFAQVIEPDPVHQQLRELAADSTSESHSVCTFPEFCWKRQHVADHGVFGADSDSVSDSEPTESTALFSAEKGNTKYTTDTAHDAT